MARPRSAGFDLQREQMLAAAAQLFATRGYTASTMQQVATACGVSKATLYHYVSDKHGLLARIACDHVARLEGLALQVQARQLPPRDHLEQLILSFMHAYASAAHQHRVLTEDVKFLAEDDQRAVLAGQRRVVAAFAAAIAAVRPGLQGRRLDKPLAMLLFGMINWTFTWLRPGGPISYADFAEEVIAMLDRGLAG